MRAVRDLITSIALGACVASCGTFSWVAQPTPASTSTWEVAEADGAPAEVLESARAAVGLAAATGTLNALVAVPGSGRSLARGSETGDESPGGVTREVSRVSEAPGPERTLVTVRATAGPPVDPEREVVVRARATVGGERWAIPVEDPRVTSRFGPRIDPITGQRGRMHRGTDFGAPTGTPVLATASGTVVLGGWCDGGTGNCVVLDHVGGWRSQYFHLSRVHVSPGDEVAQGDVIGEIGSTGRSTGPHLHFQVGRGSDAVDPEDLFGEPVD